MNTNEINSEEDNAMTGPRLTTELIGLCDLITQTKAQIMQEQTQAAQSQNLNQSINRQKNSINYINQQKELLKAAKNRLKILAQNTENLEIIIRSYNWSQMLSLWKYSELNNGNGNRNGNARNSPSKQTSK